MTQIEEKLKTQGITLPESTKPAANYVPYKTSGKRVVISGQLPFQTGKISHAGKLGKDISLEEGKACARICLVNVLSHAKAAAGGDFAKISHWIRLGVFVNSTESFTEQPQVANGASDLLVELFGDKGRHARAAVGVAQLPFGAAVEVEAEFELA